MAIEIVDLPIQNGDFPYVVMLVYQRVIWSIAADSDTKLGEDDTIDRGNFRPKFPGTELSVAIGWPGVNETTTTVVAQPSLLGWSKNGQPLWGKPLKTVLDLAIWTPHTTSSLMNPSWIMFLLHQEIMWVNSYWSQPGKLACTAFATVTGKRW